MNPKVYGIRICKVCNGFCHENSYRHIYGIRKMYFCCKLHLERYIENKYRGLTLEDVKESYEKIDVITA